MKRLAFACVLSVLSWLAALSPGQDAGLSIRIETSQEGMHRIPGEMLKAHFPLDRIDPEKLALTHDGQPVAIEIFGASDGRLDPRMRSSSSPRPRENATARPRPTSFRTGGSLRA